jgi:hypothetical protein
MAEPGTTMATPAFSLRDDDLVTLLVGSDEQKFVVHESCIIRNSDFFKAALKKEWAEGQTPTIKLPEENCVETLVNYLNFAYREKLPTEDIKAKADGGFTGDPFTALAKLYVIGERILDRSVQSAVIREILRLVTIKSKGKGARSYPETTSVTVTYSGTSAGSPLRRLMVDLYVKAGTGSWNYSKHPEFLMDLWKALLEEKTLAQKTIPDFRGQVLVAEDYVN